jgi:hypothetical protein
LLESTTRAGSHAGLDLYPLGLQHRRTEQCHLLAWLYAAQDLGVIEIAGSYTNHSWKVSAILLNEYKHRAAGPAGCSRSASRRAATTTATATATATASATARSPASR